MQGKHQKWSNLDMEWHMDVIEEQLGQVAQRPPPHRRRLPPWVPLTRYWSMGSPHQGLYTVHPSRFDPREADECAIDPWAHLHTPRACKPPFQLAFGHLANSQPSLGCIQGHWMARWWIQGPPPLLAPIALLPSTNLQHAYKYPPCLVLQKEMPGSWIIIHHRLQARH